jgi:hypothetical protein
MHRIIRNCLALIAMLLLNMPNASAANNLAQCVQVTSSSVTASSLNPQYVVTVKDACDTDLGSVTIQFYSGSNDIRSATPQFRSIFKLSKWGDTLYFDLGNLAKGVYVPRLNVTVGKEPWNPNNIFLSSFTITGGSASAPTTKPTNSPTPQPSPAKTLASPNSEPKGVITAKIFPADKSWAAWIKTFEYVSGPNPLVSNKGTRIKISGGCTPAGKTVQVMKNRSDSGAKYPNGMRYVKPILVCKAGRFSGTVIITGDTKISITELPTSHGGTEILFRLNQELSRTDID